MKKATRKSSQPRESWVNKAYFAGSNAASTIQLLNEESDSALEPREWEQRMFEEWLGWFRTFSFNSFPYRTYPAACRQFIEGFSLIADIDRYPYLLPPTLKTIGCVITDRNQEQILQDQLNELVRLPFAEIIIVLNGTADNSYRLVREHPARMKVVHNNASLGYDWGRALGAKQSSADIMLFLDGDVCISAERLLPFIDTTELGADIVLNPLSQLMPEFAERDALSMINEFVNRCMQRPDLQIDSLAEVPHAISRKALETIGYRVLAIPPLAQEYAVRSRLSIERCSVAVDAFRANRVKGGNSGQVNAVERLMIRDQLEAIHEIIKRSG